MSSGAYDHPNALVRREHCTGGVVAGTAGVDVALFRPFQKGLLKAVHMYIVIAGTATNTYDIKNGTTSIGAIVPGTETASATLVVSGLDNEMAAGDLISLDGSTTDATGQHVITYEWEVRHDAVQSA